MQVVTSPRNPLLKDVRKAVQRGGLTADGLCVAEGHHLLDEASRSGCEIPYVFISPGSRISVPPKTSVIELDADLFESITATETSQGVIALVRPPAWTLDDMFRSRALVVVLDALQDPGNCGAIIRSAEAFGATGVVFMKGSANAYNPKCLRASAGSIFRVPAVTGMDELPQQDVECYALSANGFLDISECSFERPSMLIVGSEGHGVSERMRERAIGVRVPTLKVESLNAALAAGIALYEARRKRLTVESV